MLGVPSGVGAIGAALIALGAIAVACAWLVRGRPRLWRSLDGVAVIALAATAAATPFLVWRIAEDLRYTTGLDGYEQSAAGPIQAFLPGYLADGAARIVPRDATYATVVGGAVPQATARKAFPALVLARLFPRRSTSVAKADWIVAWGIDPRRVAQVGAVRVAHPAQGPLPPVLVAQVRR